LTKTKEKPVYREIKGWKDTGKNQRSKASACGVCDVLRHSQQREGKN